MRTLAVAAITSLIALAMASAAGAAPSISVVWTGTTGSGVTGGSSIASAAGDTLQLDVLITTTLGPGSGGGASFASISVQDNGGGISAGTLQAGVDDFQDFLGNSHSLLTTGTYGGAALSYISGVVCPYPATGNFPAAIGGATCGTLSAGINAGDQGGGLYGSYSAGPGVNFSIAYTFTQARLIVAVVPEPATGGLLALGLGALVFIGRRRA